METTSELDANQFIEDEPSVFRAAPEKLEITLMPEMVRFDDGEEVMLTCR